MKEKTEAQNEGAVPLHHPPLACAAFSLLVVPLLSLIFVMAGILCLAAWPLVPIWVYAEQRKGQSSNRTEQ